VKHYSFRLKSVGPAICWLICSALLCAPLSRGAEAEQTSIDITNPAPDGPGGEFPRELIAGKAQAPDISTLKVVIYTKTDKWYVQPYVNNPLTDIKADGTWSARIALGHRYGAILVRPSFKPSATLAKLPQVGGDVLAVIEKDSKK
jgi:hypothetical protein